LGTQACPGLSVRKSQNQTETNDGRRLGQQSFLLATLRKKHETVPDHPPGINAWVFLGQGSNRARAKSIRRSTISNNPLFTIYIVQVHLSRPILSAFTTPTSSKMRLAAPVQILLLAFSTTASTASPLAAPSANEAEVAARTADSTVEKRSYTSTCRICHLTWFEPTNPSIACECRRPGGQWVEASIVLNNCIANRNGNLAWAREFVPRFN
jgi:hypothetical protein